MLIDAVFGVKNGDGSAKVLTNGTDMFKDTDMFNISTEIIKDTRSDYGALRRHSSGCSSKDCVNVSITDDLELEMVESFNINLEKSQGLSNKFLLAPGHREVIIIDNDGTYVSLQLLQHCYVIVYSCAQKLAV